MRLSLGEVSRTATGRATGRATFCGALIPSVADTCNCNVGQLVLLQSLLVELGGSCFHPFCLFCRFCSWRRRGTACDTCAAGRAAGRIRSARPGCAKSCSCTCRVRATALAALPLRPLGPWRLRPILRCLPPAVKQALTAWQPKPVQIFPPRRLLLRRRSARLCSGAWP